MVDGDINCDGISSSDLLCQSLDPISLYSDLRRKLATGSLLGLGIILALGHIQYLCGLFGHLRL